MAQETFNIMSLCLAGGPISDHNFDQVDELCVWQYSFSDHSQYEQLVNDLVTNSSIKTLTYTLVHPMWMGTGFTYEYLSSILERKKSLTQVKLVTDLAVDDDRLLAAIVQIGVPNLNLIDWNTTYYTKFICSVLSSNRNLRKLSFELPYDKTTFDLIRQHPGLDHLVISVEVGPLSDYIFEFMKHLNASHISKLRVIFECDGDVTVLQYLIQRILVNRLRNLTLEFHTHQDIEGIKWSQLIQHLDKNRCLQNLRLKFVEDDYQTNEIRTLEDIMGDKAVSHLQSILQRNYEGWQPNSHHVYDLEIRQMIELFVVFLSNLFPPELMFIILNLTV